MASQNLQVTIDALWNTEVALDYLESRGLTPQTIRRYLLGYDHWRHAITIPYLNALDEVRRMRYRNLSSDPKYIWDTGGERGNHIFHVKATRKPELWITEGEFDAMILAQMGYPSIAIPGAKGFKPAWRYLFAYTKRVTLVFDYDVKPDGSNPGLEGAQRLAGLLGTVGPELRMARMPPNEDVTDLYLKDRSRLEEIIRG